ncbi:hypothetical protein ACFQ4H_33895, partial [Micromonospora sonneratiae]
MRRLDRSWRRWTGYGTAVVMAVSMVSAPERAAADVGPTWADLPRDPKVTGAPAKLTPLPANPAAAAAIRALPAPTWPVAGSASVELAGAVAAAGGDGPGAGVRAG